MDAIEQSYLRACGWDPHDPAVTAAIDLVRWELQIAGRQLKPDPM